MPLLALDPTQASQAATVYTTNDVMDIMTALWYWKIFNYVAKTILVYDYLTTMGIEIKYMWARGPKWTGVVLNVLIMIQRYMPFIDTLILHDPAGLISLNPTTCRTTTIASAWCYLVGIGISEVILTIRVWAVSGKPRYLAFGLPTFFVVCWSLQIVLLSNFLHSLQFGYLGHPDQVFPMARGCYGIAGNSLLYLNYVIGAVYDLGLMVLMIISAAREFPSLCRASDRSTLSAVIYRDGVAYYIILFSLSGANIASDLVLPFAYCGMLNSLQRVFHAVLTSRVVFNIREHSDRLAEYDIDNDAHELSSTIQF